MEDVWKDITLSTLSSLQNPSPHLFLRETPTPTPHHLHFQDFLARPFSSIHEQTKNILVSAASLSSPAPQTILSLNTRTNPPPDFHLADSFNPFDDTFSSAQFGKRRLPEIESDDVNLSSQYSCERRHKRMIKNRESAARSRARKQAYTNELELEVAHLQQENARLRMEQETSNLATWNQCPKKLKLHRSSTAPF